MSQPNSHTHCQVAQADPQAKTWQRVCLFQPTTDRQQLDRDRRAAHNKVLPKAGVTDFYDTFVLNQTLVFQINSSAEKPRLRQYPNRWQQV